MSYNWDQISKFLFEFERSKYAEIIRLKTGGFLTWQLVKAPIYYHLIRKTDQISLNSKKNKSKTGFGLFLYGVRKIFNISKCFLSLLFLIFRSIKLKKPVLILASSEDKFTKDKNGKYVNHLFDPIISHEIISNYIYLENISDNQAIKESRYKIDFYSNQLKHIRFLFKNKYLGDANINREARNITEVLNDFFYSNGINLEIEVSFINAVLVNFYIDRQIYRLIYRLISPKLILTSEKLGTGALAASKIEGIPSIDFQHGLIDEFNPQYQYAGELRKNKDSLILPDLIALFGNLYKDILIQHGFWDEKELHVVGSSRIEINRKGIIKNEPQNSILLPTQWTVFNEIIFLLESLMKFPKRMYNIQLKLHPLEFKEHIDSYKLIVQKYSPYIVIVEDDIYQLFNHNKVILGFDSTALLEAIAMGKPCITIGIPSMPNGIHNLFGSTDELKDAILPVSLNDVEKIHNLLNLSMSDTAFHEQWKGKAKFESERIYANNYFGNLKAMIEKYS